MRKNPTEEKNEYRRLKKAAKKAVAIAMKEESVRMINELGINRKNVDQDEKLHEDVATMSDFSYLGDIIYSGGGCEAAVTSRT